MDLQSLVAQMLHKQSKPVGRTKAQMTSSLRSKCKTCGVTTRYAVPSPTSQCRACEG